jgi:hypothetical protein
MAEGMVYNSPRFKPKIYNWDVFVGPAAGEPATDFTLTDLDTGEQVALAGLRGTWTVIETGSSTCSMYTKNIPGMEALRAEHPDVTFMVVYVREAHPGERLGQHNNFEEKKAAARLLEPKYREHRKIMVDSLTGDFHRAYGAMPNVVYIINPDGIIHYRCDWATVDGVRAALEDRSQPNTVEHADMAQLHASRGMGIAIRTMWAGGLVALWDFFVAGPRIAKLHKMIDDYYREHGKFKQQTS